MSFDTVKSRAMVLKLHPVTWAIWRVDKPFAESNFAVALRSGRRQADADLIDRAHRQGVFATPETSGKPGNLAAEEKDVADIIGGNATGDKKRVDAATTHHARLISVPDSRNPQPAA